MKIYGVVVLYNSDVNVLNNISSYLNDVDKLYVVDNSEIYNNSLIQKLQNDSKIQYIDNKGNRGIAYALNLGAKLAIDDNINWLLTMDQDSGFDKGSLEKMIKWINEKKTDNIAIVSPMHSVNARDNYQRQYDLVTMTSGNLLNLKIFQKIGGFDEKLFIDSVDTEYCLRLNMNGYRIKRCKEIILRHNLGDIEIKNFLFCNFYVTNHNAIRWYYIARNRLYTWKKYKKYFAWYIRYEQKMTLKQMVKIVAEDDKILKFKMIFKGYIDYKKGKFGKFNV